MDVRERSLKGLAGMGSYRLLSQALSWAASVALARLLEPSDYGLMALGVFFVNFFTFVSEFGLSSALIQRPTLSDKEAQSAFWAMLAANVLVYGLVSWVAHFAGQYYRAADLTSVIRVLGLNFVISSVRMMPLCLLTRELQFERGALADFLASLTGIVLVLLLASLGFGVWSLVAGSITQNTVSTICLLWLKPWYPRLTCRLQDVRDMLGYGFSVNASKVLNYLVDNADNLVVGRVLGQQALGLYNMAYILGTVPTQKVSPVLFHIAFPVFSRLHDDAPGSARYFLSASRYLSLAALPVLVGLALVADVFVVAVLGTKWQAITWTLRLLCLVGLLKALAIVVSPLLFARKRTGSLLFYSCVAALALPAAFVLGVRFGIEGVAAAWLCVYPALFLGPLRLALREVHVSFATYLATLAPALVGTATMAVSVLVYRVVVPGGPWYDLSGSIAVGALTYVVTVLLTTRGLMADLRSAVLVVVRR